MSVEQIATEAGVSKLTVYSHFRDKEALFFTAIEEQCRQHLPDAIFAPPAATTLERALGETLTEPKPSVWFEPSPQGGLMERIVLDRRTRMLYDERHVFVNGESWRAAGRDAALMRLLADTRTLGPEDLARASDDALELLGAWCDAGWAHARSSD